MGVNYYLSLLWVKGYYQYICEPDSFYTGECIEKEHFEIDTRVSLTKPDYILLSYLPHYLGVGLGLSKAQEVRLGFGQTRTQDLGFIPCLL